jgi:ribonuclease R
MPISSKRVIEFIHGFRGESFSSDELISLILSRSKKKPGERSPKRSTKDFLVINTTLSALRSIGYLCEQNRRIHVNSTFPLSGTIRISKGSAEVVIGKLNCIVKPENLENAHNGDTVDVAITEISKNTVFCRVKRVTQKSRDRYLAILETKTKGMLIFRLVDIPGEHYVATERFPDEPSAGDYATVRVTGKMIAGRPACEILERFAAGSDEHDIDRIILRHNLPGPHKEYPEFTDIRTSVPASELLNRIDFTDLLTVTIDGEHSKDFDDAVSFKKINNGYTLYVHIADVSAYVELNSPLDKEAFRRGTSYYLGDRVIPMLPEILSNNLCSLRPHEERLTLTAIMDYDADGHLKKYNFTRGIIRSHKRLTYSIVHNMIENPDDSELSQMLSALYAFTVILKKNRRARGRIDLQVNDFELIYKDGHFEEIMRAQRFKSHSLIEEAMLSANEAVSRVLREQKIPALYRVHEPMSGDQLGSLRTFLRALGVKFKEDKNLGRSLQSIVDSVAGKEYAHVVNFVILRSMMQAFYGERPLGHFGLGFSDYTHFTSPIRRYPDLIVHRCLKTFIDSTSPPYTDEDLSAIGLESSRLERIAQKAERDLFKIKSCRMMTGHEGESFDVIVSGVSKYGIYVTLTDTPIEGMVPLRTMNDDFYIIIEDQFAAVGRRNGKRYTLGDHVKARLSRVDIVTLQIDFEFITGKGKKNEADSIKESPRKQRGRHHRVPGRRR